MFVRKILWAALVVLASAGSATGAARSLERAMETNTDAVYLPASTPSTIDARGCPQCPSLRLEVPATARFFVGDEEVTLAELRKYVLGKRYDMVIFYEREAPVVRRIVVAGSLPRQQ